MKAKTKQKPRQFDIETVKIPVPTGDSERHLYEVKLLLTMPAGYSMNQVFGAIVSWILRGSHGNCEVLAEYGGGLKNKTLMTKAGRGAFSASGRAGRVMCTAFDNKALPANDTEMLVMREKMLVKKVRKGS